VKVSTSETHMNHNAMTFDIEGDLWMQPLPLRLYLKSELDLNTGIMDILDKTG
jgi:type VI secretion system protein ImpF